MLEKYPLKGGYSLEKEFQTAYLKALRDHGYVAYKIQDAGLGYKFLDSFCVDEDGVTTFVEFKIIDGMTFNVSHFERSQVVLLHDLELRKEDCAIVAVWSKKRGDYVLKKFSEIWKAKNEKGGVKLFK